MSFVCRISVIIACIVVLNHSTTVAQFSMSKYEVGLNAGTLIYQGDLSRSFKGDYKTIKPAIGVYVSKTLDPYFALRANVNLGKIGADETQYTTPFWKQYRGFKFSSTVTELSSTLVFSPLGQSNDENFHRLSPYVFAGAGLAFVHIKRDWSALNKTFYDSKSTVQLGLGIDTVHTLPKVIPVLPVGFGVRYAIGSQFSINAEATYRFTATDYLDGFKYSGNPAKKDSYYGLTIGVSYRFGSYKCPTVK